MLRKTALKRLTLHNRTGELVAEFRQAQLPLRLLSLSKCRSGALPAENDVRISLPARAAVLLSVYRKLRWAGKPRPYICILL
jgi:hypothetical protein